MVIDSMAYIIYTYIIWSIGKKEKRKVNFIHTVGGGSLNVSLTVFRIEYYV